MRRLSSSWSLYCAVFFIVFSSFSYTFERYVIETDKDLISLSGEIALAEVGTMEKSNKNDGEVQKYLAAVGLKGNYPYCAAGQYYCFKKAADSLKIKNIPLPKSALCYDFHNYAARMGRKSKAIASKNDLIIWRKGNTIFGHTERILEVGSAGWVRTIAFNVRCGSSEGVCLKKRNIYHILNRMKVLSLIGFEEAKL